MQGMTSSNINMTYNSGIKNVSGIDDFTKK